MKKILIILFTLYSFCGFSQIKLAVVAGVQITNMDIKRDLNFHPTSAQLNPLLGVYAEYAFKSNLSISSELRYTPFSYKASKMEVVASNGNPLGEISKHKINFIQIPISVNYNFDIEKRKIKFGLGPVFNIKISDKLFLMQPSNGSTKNAIIANTTGVLNFTTGFYLNSGISFSDFAILVHAQKSLTGIYKAAIPSDVKFNGYSIGINFLYFFKK